MNQEEATELAQKIMDTYPHTDAFPELVGKTEEAGYTVRVYAEVPHKEDMGVDRHSFLLAAPSLFDWMGAVLQVLSPRVQPPAEEKQPPALKLTAEHVRWLDALFAPYHMESGKFAQVEEDVLYIRPTLYGERRYHMVTLSHSHGLVLEQTDQSEKYQQRLTLEQEEFEPFLRQLLIWWLGKIKPGLEELKQSEDQFGSF